VAGAAAGPAEEGCAANIGNAIVDFEMKLIS
jgi:hypothetical protein